MRPRSARFGECGRRTAKKAGGEIREAFYGRRLGGPSMPRPLGRRNPDYEEKREKLVQELADHVLRSELKRPSFRQLAAAAQVSEPTLRHYFGDRDGAAADILRALGERARPFIEAVAQPARTLGEAVDTYVALAKVGVAHGGFARAHAFGLVEGVADERVGRVYLEALLEPSLAALEARLRPHVADPAQARAAALLVFAPMLLAVIHQELLGGRETAPLDLSALFDAIAALTRKGVG